MILLPTMSRFCTSPAAAAEEAPEWVPAGYDIWIEPRILDGFATGRAWVAGVGIVAVNTLLGTDPNTSNGWSNTQYTEANLTADGYTTTNVTAQLPPALIGEALARIMAGATLVTKIKSPTAASSSYYLLLDAAGNDALEFKLAQTDPFASRGSAWANSYNTAAVNGVVNAGAADDYNILAVSLTHTHADYSVNGNATVSGATGDWSGTLVAAVVDVNGLNACIEWIGIRTAVEIAAALPALTTLS